MSTRVAPEPKLARITGASAELRRLPNSRRTAAVAMMTSERSRLAALGRSTFRSAAGIRCAASSRHITGSQDTLADRLTWVSIQAAASLAAAAAACWLLPGPGMARETATAPAITAATTTAAATGASHARQAAVGASFLSPPP